MSKPTLATAARKLQRPRQTKINIASEGTHWVLSPVTESVDTPDRHKIDTSLPRKLRTQQKKHKTTTTKKYKSKEFITYSDDSDIPEDHLPPTSSFKSIETSPLKSKSTKTTSRTNHRTHSISATKCASSALPLPVHETVFPLRRSSSIPTIIEVELRASSKKSYDEYDFRSDNTPPRTTVHKPHHFTTKEFCAHKPFAIRIDSPSLWDSSDAEDESNIRKTTLKNKNKVRTKRSLRKAKSAPYLRIKNETSDTDGETRVPGLLTERAINLLTRGSSPSAAMAKSKTPQKLTSRKVVRSASIVSDSSSDAESDASTPAPAATNGTNRSGVSIQHTDSDTPRGFTILPTTSTSPFTSENLAGKQIFHITAPSSLDLMKRGKRLKLDPSSNGSEFTLDVVDGVSWSIRKTQERSPSLKVLVPEVGKNDYIPSNISTSAQFIITETPPITNHTQTSSHATAKQHRLQPEGMKVRFKPSGWGDEDAPICFSTVQQGRPEIDAMEIDNIGGNVEPSKLKEKEKKHKPKDENTDTVDRPKKKRKTSIEPITPKKKTEIVVNGQQSPPPLATSQISAAAAPSSSPTSAQPSSALNGDVAKKAAMIVPEKKDNETKEEKRLRRALKKEAKVEKRKAKGKI